MGMQTDTRRIAVVDDDPAVRDALATVFALEGFKVDTYSNGMAFLAARGQSKPAAVLMDVQMPGKSGIDILRELRSPNHEPPIFIITGHGTISLAVEAIKAGAFDMIEKPFDSTTVVNRVAAALQAKSQAAGDPASVEAMDFPGRETLTPRERQVLAEIVAGQSNKQAGRDLGISPRTIEVHRARIMEKLGAKNAADLARLVFSARR
jgi:two-component system, LuxR family, response regulator FixJ